MPRLCGANGDDDGTSELVWRTSGSGHHGAAQGL